MIQTDSRYVSLHEFLILRLFVKSNWASLRPMLILHLSDRKNIEIMTKSFIWLEPKCLYSFSHGCVFLIVCKSVFCCIFLFLKDYNFVFICCMTRFKAATIGIKYVSIFLIFFSIQCFELYLFLTEKHKTKIMAGVGQIFVL